MYSVATLGEKMCLQMKKVGVYHVATSAVNYITGVAS